MQCNLDVCLSFLISAIFVKRLTDRPTDGQAKPLIEMHGRISRNQNYNLNLLPTADRLERSSSIWHPDKCDDNIAWVTDNNYLA